MTSKNERVVTAVQCEPLADPGLFNDLLMSGGAWDSIIIKGNDRDFAPVIGDKVSDLFEIVQAYVDFRPETLEENEEYMVDYGLSENTLKRIIAECNYYDHEASYYSRIENLTAALLTILTGKKYDWVTIRGYCQGDWNILYYPAGLDSDIGSIECMYFGMLSEFIIDNDYVVTVLDCENTNETLKDYGVSRVEYINGYTTVPTYTTIEI